MPSIPPTGGADFFHLLVDGVKEYAIIALDAEGRVATWNPGAQRLHGYRAGEVLGRSHEILFPPEEVAERRPKRLLQRAAEAGQIEEEGWRVRKDGTRYLADVAVAPLRDGLGTLIGYAVVMRDLSRRLERQAAQAREMAEARARERAAFRQVAHALASAAGVTAVLGQIAERALSITQADGAYVEQLSGVVVEVIARAGSVHPPLGARAPYPGSLTEEVRGTGKVERVDDIASAQSRPMSGLLRRSCGGCSAAIAPLRAGEDMLGSLVVLRRAGRDRFSAEEAERLLALADMGALAIHRAAVLLEAERHAREERALREAAGAVVAAFTVEQMVPQIARSALEATDADGSLVERLDAAHDRLDVVAAAGPIRLRTTTSVRYSGSFAEYAIERGEPVAIPRLGSAERPLPPHWADACSPDCSALVVGLVEAGEVIGALLLLRAPGSPPFEAADIARARTFANLASLAFRKVHLLQESEQRRQELEQVTESRARLVRGFSHDVKNPLSASLGFVQLLLDGFMGAPTPEQSDALRRIDSGINAAISLIDDLVNLARVESGQMEIRPEAVDIRQAAREVVGQFAAAAERKNLDISLDLPTQLAPIRTDPTRVRQILGNLLSNAVKYTPAGGSVDVRVNERTARREQGNGPWLAVHVVDTGPGIAPEDQERIFREFTRLSPTAAEGSGLGLSISRRIARLLGGDLTVESEPGHGSSFTLWLPGGGAAQVGSSDRRKAA